MKLQRMIYFISIIFICFILNCNENKNDLSSVKNHPLYIESLRKRNFSISTLIIKEKVKSNKYFESYIVSYRSGGLKQYALMNIPKIKKKKYPVIIVNHGYIPPDKYSTVYSYKNTSAYFAQNGFLVLKPDYRGHDKSETNENSPMTRIEYTVDVINLIYSLKTLYIADEENIFMYGHSMGGDVTLRVLETTDLVKAATLWAPVSTNFPESFLYFVRKHDKAYADKIMKYLLGEFEEIDFFKFSVNHNTKYIKIPLNIHHGTNDESVPYEWSIELSEELKKNSIKHEFFTYENENHNISKSFYKVLKRDIDFFTSQMK